MPKFYFKKTWCGMVLMILYRWEDDGKTRYQYYKATESQAQKIMKEKSDDIPTPKN